MANKPTFNSQTPGYTYRIHKLNSGEETSIMSTAEVINAGHLETRGKTKQFHRPWNFNL